MFEYYLAKKYFKNGIISILLNVHNFAIQALSMHPVLSERLRNCKDYAAFAGKNCVADLEKRLDRQCASEFRLGHCLSGLGR